MCAGSRAYAIVCVHQHGRDVGRPVRVLCRLPAHAFHLAALCAPTIAVIPSSCIRHVCARARRCRPGAIRRIVASVTTRHAMLAARLLLADGVCRVLFPACMRRYQPALRTPRAATPLIDSVCVFAGLRARARSVGDAWMLGCRGCMPCGCCECCLPVVGMRCKTPLHCAQRAGCQHYLLSLPSWWCFGAAVPAQQRQAVAPTRACGVLLAGRTV